MGNILRQGITAYQQTMRRQPETPETEMPENGGVKAPAAVPAQGLYKTLLPPPPKEESKIRRVAKFLVLTGSGRAAEILKELDPPQVEAISREIATIRGIGPEEAQSILAEFNSLLSAPGRYSGASSGGIETARRILYTAYGPEKGEALLNKTVPGSKENVFGFLEEFTPEQVVFLLKDETPAASALVLARLPPKMSAETLVKFPPELKPEVLRRIARQSEIAPEVLERVAAAIRERARHLGGSSRDIAIDGMQTLAAILKQGDYSFGDRIINELETEEPDIGKDLKDRLYTLDDVIGIFDRPLAEKLSTMTDTAVALLLKGRSGEFCEKILANVSARRRSLIREEGEILGTVTKRECDEAANDFIAWFRMARENGELLLTSDEDWVV